VVSSTPLNGAALESEKEKLELWSLLVVAVEAVEGVGKGRGGKLVVTMVVGGWIGGSRSRGKGPPLFPGNSDILEELST
jgi:hypothetical protein